MLLALLASKRQSDLQAIDLRFKKCIPEGGSFQLAALTKTITATKSMELTPSKLIQLEGQPAQLPGTGVFVQDILQTADWTRETTFTCFYYCLKYSNSFGEAVLNGESLL